MSMHAFADMNGTCGSKMSATDKANAELEVLSRRMRRGSLRWAWLDTGGIASLLSSPEPT